MAYYLAVDRAWALDEPGDGDDHAAAAVEEALGLVEPLRCQEDVAAESLRERPATEVSDGKPDVVADGGAEHGECEHHGDVHVAGHRHTEVSPKMPGKWASVMT